MVVLKQRARGKTKKSKHRQHAKKHDSSKMCQWITNFVVGSLLLLLVYTNVRLYQGQAVLSQQQAAFLATHKEQFFSAPNNNNNNNNNKNVQQGAVDPPSSSSFSSSLLQDLNILVAIASFDFDQVPHLEETLDGYHELCVAGATTHVYIHTTVVYPVAWLDLWKTRWNCAAGFQLTFVVVNKGVRLHLVDLHRELFYDQLDKYDLFIYTEDDMRVTPTTVATYWQTTLQLQVVGRYGLSQL